MDQVTYRAHFGDRYPVGRAPIQDFLHFTAVIFLAQDVGRP